MSELTPAAPGDVVLRTRNLSRAFGKVTAVAGIDLEVPRGEVYGFLGRNGAGKTTTLRMLMGILRPDAGTIELLGRESKRIGPEQKREIGYVSQEQFFYPWMTARELGRFVSGFYPHWDGPEFDRLLRVLDVPDKRKASELSGGTRTKLALALALAHHPELLLLDEPTTGLDPVARREFLEMLLHEVRHRGQTVFFSSHLVGEVELVATRIGILQRGALRYQGSLAQLRATVRRVVLPAAGEAGFAAPSLGGGALGGDQSGSITTSLPSTGALGPSEVGAAAALLTASDGQPHREVAFGAPPESVQAYRTSEAAASSAPTGTSASAEPAPDRASVEVAGPEAAPELAPSRSGHGAPAETALRGSAPPPGLFATTLPEGFTLVREETRDGLRTAVVLAAAERWDGPDAPLGSGERLSLEEIFLAFAREGQPLA